MIILFLLFLFTFATLVDRLDRSLMQLVDIKPLVTLWSRQWYF